jgi:hypothetical protein
LPLGFRDAPSAARPRAPRSETPRPRPSRDAPGWGPSLFPAFASLRRGQRHPTAGRPLGARGLRPAERMSLHPRGRVEYPPPAAQEVSAGKSPSRTRYAKQRGFRAAGGWGQTAPWAEEKWRRSVRAPSGQTGGWKRWPRPSAVCEGGEQRGSARRSGQLGRMRRRGAQAARAAQPERPPPAHRAKKEEEPPRSGNNPEPRRRARPEGRGTRGARKTAPTQWTRQRRAGTAIVSCPRWGGKR